MFFVADEMRGRLAARVAVTGRQAVCSWPVVGWNLLATAVTRLHKLFGYSVAVGLGFFGQFLGGFQQGLDLGLQGILLVL